MANLPKIALGAWAWGNDGTFGNNFTADSLKHIFDTATFLESYEFSGKKIIPFCTSGGSGVGRSDTALHKDVSGDVKWEKGRQINRANEAEIRRWLDEVL